MLVPEGLELDYGFSFDRQRIKLCALYTVYRVCRATRVPMLIKYKKYITNKPKFITMSRDTPYTPIHADYLINTV